MPSLTMAILCIAAAAIATSDVELVAGLELTYTSNGVSSAPWRVESVENNVSIGGRTGCRRVRFAPGGPRATADVRATCEADGVLSAWDSTRSTWRATRPVRPGGTLEVPTGASRSLYTTGAETVDSIGSYTVRVIATTMVTRDSSQKVIRRLRERYAPALGTATWGVFERPDSTASGGWKVDQEFRIVAIRAP